MSGLSAKPITIYSIEIKIGYDEKWRDSKDLEMSQGMNQDIILLRDSLQFPEKRSKEEIPKSFDS